MSVLKPPWFGRTISLQDVLSIYKENYNNGKKGKNWNFLSDVVKNMNQQALGNAQAMQIMRENIILVVNQDDGEKDIFNSLVYRIPIYFGQVQNDLFDAQQLSNVLGYSIDTAQKIVNPNTRYTIMGNVFRQDGQIITMAHVWSINLESMQTYDYQKYMKNKQIIRPDYQKTVNWMVASIWTGCQKFNVNTIILPMIGLGAFLSAVFNQEDIEFAWETFLNAVYHMVIQFPKVKCRLIPFDNYTKLPFIKWYREVYQPNKNRLVNLEIPCGDPRNPKTGNDLFADIDLQVYGNICMVNPWDGVAFIGNGGMRDNTPDGFIVAGRDQEGAPNSGVWRNTSYLQNAFFNPSVLDPSHWMILKRT